MDKTFKNTWYILALHRLIMAVDVGRRKMFDDNPRLAMVFPVCY